MNQSVTSTQTFDQPVEVIWQALSDEKALKKWLFAVRNYKFEVGKTFTFYESEDTQNILHQCRFTRILPKSLIEHTWEHPEHSDGSTLVRWEVEKHENGTRLTLTHSGLEAFSGTGEQFKPENYQAGWDYFVKDALRLYLNGVEKKEFTIHIDATASHIWQTMWDKELYTQWTAPFCEGSFYKGELGMNQRVHFLIPSGNGMYSNVASIKENDHIIFQHVGEIESFKELPLNEKSGKWAGSTESYQFLPDHAGCKLKVIMDIEPQYVESIEPSFQSALQKLKNICEKK